MKVGTAQVATIPNFVSAADCERWLAQVWDDKEFWENRFEFINSYGSAWYLDIEVGLLNYYYANATATNERLQRLEGLVQKLSSVCIDLVAPDGSTGHPARPRKDNLGPYWADAGVVIMTRGREGEIHADYEGLAPYPAKLFDANTRAYSAVLSLFKPKIGGNLKIWLKRFLGNEKPELEDYFAQVADYAPGSVTIFDSFCYHQILASELTDDRPYRAIAGMHFLYMDAPYPHWEYWF